MSDVNTEKEFQYVVTCIPHHVTGFGLAHVTMINTYLYKNIYLLTLLQSRVLWNHVIASEQMVDNYEKYIYYGHCNFYVIIRLSGA